MKRKNENHSFVNAILGILISISSITYGCSRNDYPLSNGDDAETHRLASNTKTRYRTIDEAKELSLKYAQEVSLFETRSEISREIGDAYYITGAATRNGLEDTLMIVVNFKESSGFSIITADRNLDPFIAITDKGYYNGSQSTGIEAFDYFMNKTVSSIANLRDSLVNTDQQKEVYSPRSQGYSPIDTVSTCLFDNRVSPLVPVKWGQHSIYGQYCPNGISGCVATAIAQVLASHQSPSSFTASVNMGTDFSSGSTITLPWVSINQHIVKHTGTQSCNSVHNNIGALLREIGYRVHMNYWNGSSGAYEGFIPSALSTFGYTCDAISAANINNMVSSLNNGRSVILVGWSNVGAHAWVCDGYIDYCYIREIWQENIFAGPEGGTWTLVDTIFDEKQVFHFNWGWDGECNGYFNYGTYGGVPVTPDVLIPDEAPDFSEDILNINNIRPL